MQSVIIKYRGHIDSLDELKTSEKTRQNYGAATMTSSRVVATTPDGILGGMVACMDAAGVNRGVTAGGDRPSGLFSMDYNGPDYENQGNVAAGKVGVIKSQGVYELYYYETRNEADTADLTFTPGLPLYASQNSLLTTDSSTNANVVGYVRELLSSGYLRMDLSL